MASLNTGLDIFWFRRDLRISDNKGLFHALKSGNLVQPIFIFDAAILSKLNNTYDRRVSFIYNEVSRLKKELVALGSDLWVFYGEPEQVFKQILSQNKINTLTFNADYEPYGLNRDKTILQWMHNQGIVVQSLCDHLIFEPGEVLKSDGTPYTVFTPFMKTWRSRFSLSRLHSFDATPLYFRLNRTLPISNLCSLESIGFKYSNPLVEPVTVPYGVISQYHKTRDLLGVEYGTSRLSVHLRFGTLSVRQLMQAAWELNETFVNELIWREFYATILFFFPHVAIGNFKPAYDKVLWRNNMREFDAWCNAETGYDIVDAAMVEISETGFMHNRARMIVSGFLTKHLLIDWRLGEAWFAEKLTDYELASNNGGWQWSAGTGCDAAPYFRVFNPTLQAKRYDSDGCYVRKWLGNRIIKPPAIVDHTLARNRCIEVFRHALKGDF